MIRSVPWYLGKVRRQSPQHAPQCQLPAVLDDAAYLSSASGPFVQLPANPTQENISASLGQVDEEIMMLTHEKHAITVNCQRSCMIA